jgi:hypothetical protein
VLINVVELFNGEVSMKFNCIILLMSFFSYIEAQQLDTNISIDIDMKFLTVEYSQNGKAIDLNSLYKTLKQYDEPRKKLNNCLALNLSGISLLTCSTVLIAKQVVNDVKGKNVNIPIVFLGSGIYIGGFYFCYLANKQEIAAVKKYNSIIYRPTKQE